MKVNASSAPVVVAHEAAQIATAEPRIGRYGAATLIGIIELADDSDGALLSAAARMFGISRAPALIEPVIID